MKYKKCKNLESQIVDSGLVVIDTDRGVIHELNKTAMMIWKMLDSAKESGEVVSRLNQKYKKVRTNVVKRTLEELWERKLVEKMA